MLASLFRSKAEVRVLGVLFSSEGLHLREIARRAGVSPFEAKRELDQLHTLGVFRKEKRGNQLLFFLDSSCPFLPELRSLYLKTEGAARQLKGALAGLPNIRYAFVFGSLARGKERSSSDVDVLVVGNADEEKLAHAVSENQWKSGREINYILWTEQDFRKKLGEKSAFLRSVVKNKKIWLAGNEHEFGRVVAQALGGKSRAGRSYR